MQTQRNTCTLPPLSSIWLPPGPRQCLNPDLVTFECVRGGKGLWFQGFDFTWRRSPRARSWDKSPGCSRCLWVGVGHGSAPHSNPLSVSRLLLFLSSIHLAFQWRGRSARNNGLLLPPLSSRQWECILNRGHGEPRGFLSLLSLFSPLLHAFTSPCSPASVLSTRPLLRPTLPLFCFGLCQFETT